MDAIFAEAARREALNLPFAIVTIIGANAVVPRRSGRMLVDEEGGIVSTVGGHLIESKAVEAAVAAIREGRGRRLSVQMPSGEVELMIDVVNPIKKACIVGYGHVGQALAPLLFSVGYAVYIYDIHPVGDVPFAAEVHVGGSWQEVFKDFKADSDTAFILTAHDYDVVSSIVDLSGCFYVGSVSSRRRLLKKGGVKAGVNMPIGLDIKAETPEELAVAITAEVMRVRSSSSGSSLADRLRRLIVVRGAGDLATATIIKLHRAGYQVVALEVPQPTQVRRNVSFAEAMYEGEWEVDGVRARRVDDVKDCFTVLDEGLVPVLADPDAKAIDILHPTVVIDAIIAKKNLGTRIGMAPLVIALGPGFEAGRDVDLVIETKRGHDLGRVIRSGSAAPNTGIPGEVAGHSVDRVVRSDGPGLFKGVKTFGDLVKAGEVIAYVDGRPQRSLIDGMVRGMLHDGLAVTEGFKIADVDPRGASVDYQSPSDKARAIAGGVLEAVDSFFASEGLV